MRSNIYTGDWNDIPDGIWTALPEKAHSPLGADGHFWRVFCKKSDPYFQQAYRMSAGTVGAVTYFRYGDSRGWRDWYQPYANSIDIIPITKKTSSGTYFSQVCKIVHVFFRIDLVQSIDKNTWVIIDRIPDGISLPKYTTQFPVASYRPNDTAYGEVRNDGTVRAAVYFDTSEQTQLYANFWYLAA